MIERKPSIENFCPSSIRGCLFSNAQLKGLPLLTKRCCFQMGVGFGGKPGEIDVVLHQTCAFFFIFVEPYLVFRPAVDFTSCQCKNPKTNKNHYIFSEMNFIGAAILVKDLLRLPNSLDFGTSKAALALSLLLCNSRPQLQMQKHIFLFVDGHRLTMTSLAAKSFAQQGQVPVRYLVWRYGLALLRSTLQEAIEAAVEKSFSRKKLL